MRYYCQNMMRVAFMLLFCSTNLFSMYYVDYTDCAKFTNMVEANNVDGALHIINDWDQQRSGAYNFGVWCKEPVAFVAPAEINPLYVAVCYQKPALVEALLKLGVNVTNDVLQAALASGDDQIIQLIGCDMIDDNQADMRTNSDGWESFKNKCVTLCRDVFTGRWHTKDQTEKKRN